MPNSLFQLSELKSSITSPPIDCLSDDILIQIFCLLRIDRDNHSYRCNADPLYWRTFIGVSHTCRRWRKLSLERAFFWSAINSYLLLWPNWTKAFLDRSADAVLSINIMSIAAARGKMDTFNKNLQLVLESRSCITALVLSGAVAPDSKSLLTEKSWSLLIELFGGKNFVIIRELQELVLEVPTHRVTLPCSFTDNLQTLRRLRLSNVSIYWDTIKLGRLTQLHLENIDPQITLEQLLAILDRSPFMESLALINTGPTYSDDHSFRSVTLAKLMDLKVVGVDYAVLQELLKYLVFGQQIEWYISCRDLPISPSSALFLDGIAQCAKVHEKLFVEIKSHILLEWHSNGYNGISQRRGKISGLKIESFQTTGDVCMKLEYLARVICCGPWSFARSVHIGLYVDTEATFRSDVWRVFLQSIPNMTVLTVEDIESKKFYIEELPEVLGTFRTDQGDAHFLLPHLEKLSFIRFDFCSPKGDAFFNALQSAVDVRSSHGLRLKTLDVRESTGKFEAYVKPLRLHVKNVLWNRS